MENKIVAIVLAAGQGKRMNSQVAKQYLEIREKPLLYYTLMAFQQSKVEEIVLVTGKEEEQYCLEKIVLPYGITKVQAVVAGGKERYDSVYEGLKKCEGATYVLIHDGARPCVSSAIIDDTIRAVKEHEACIVTVPVKDTIKTVSKDGVVQETLPRDVLQIVQTPQAFSYPLIRDAYDRLMLVEHSSITDDAMVVEKMTKVPIHVVEGSYANIKVTTPEDLPLAERFLFRE